MNAQRNNPHTLFLSFEILNANTLKLFSLWGNQESEISATTDNERQLADFFYQTDGGQNFFNICLFLTLNDGKTRDFATLDAAPREYPENYPATMPAQWDFDGWKNALLGALDTEGQNKFFAGLNAYFAAYFDGQTIFERTATIYGHIPENSYLTNGDAFLQIIQQNGKTCFLFDGKETFAAQNLDFLPITSEEMPEQILTALTKSREKFDARNEEDRNAFREWLQKETERNEKREAKAKAKEERKNERTNAKAEKAKEKAKAADDAKTESARLLKEFFALTNKTQDIEELKQWMVANQKQLLDGQGEGTDRKQATGLFRTLKTKAEQAAKEAAKAARDAEKAAETDATSTSEQEPATKAGKNGKKPAKADALTTEQAQYEMAGS